MSDPNDTKEDTGEETSQETGQETSQDEASVEGVELDPGDGKKSIEVDTHERLTAKEDEPPLEEIPTEELEKERQERLDPDNRPDNVEIDNSQRDFNPETGLFEDSEVDPPEGAPFSTTDAESSTSGSDDGDESDDSEGTEEPKDAQESKDAEESKEVTESKDTES